MKKILIIFFSFVIITSCKKSETAPVVDTVIKTEAEKNISDILITTALPIEKKSTMFFVGVRYQKNYTDIDQVSLSFDGQEGYIVSRFTDFTGNYVLFSFSGINHAINTKFKLSIKNNQKTFQKETDYKIVDDLSIKTVWNNLSASYLVGLDGELQRYSDGKFWILKQIIITHLTPNGPITDPPVPALYNVFTDDYTNPSQKLTPNVFIPGLEGGYKVTYSGDILSELNVLHGAYPSKINPQKFYNELESVFGIYKSRTQTGNETITTYSTSEFSIVTHYITDYQMYTLIKKN